MMICVNFQDLKDSSSVYYGFTYIKRKSCGEAFWEETGNHFSNLGSYGESSLC